MEVLVPCHGLNPWPSRPQSSVVSHWDNCIKVCVCKFVFADVYQSDWLFTTEDRPLTHLPKDMTRFWSRIHLSQSVTRITETWPNECTTRPTPWIAIALAKYGVTVLYLLHSFSGAQGDQTVSSDQEVNGGFDTVFTERRERDLERSANSSVTSEDRRAAVRALRQNNGPSNRQPPVDEEEEEEREFLNSSCSTWS